MHRFFTLFIASFLLAASATAQESRFSTMVADVQTGLILTADNIDEPRRATLMGRLMTIAMTMQEVSGGTTSGATSLQVTRNKRVSIDQALSETASGLPGYRASMTALANHIGGTVSGYTKALSAAERMTGLEGTAVRIVRGEDGGPAFEGYATPRDMARMATSMLRAHEQDIARVFDRATGGAKSAVMWIYQDGMCILAARGPQSHRLLVSALTGAPNEDSCLQTAVRSISDDDKRIAAAQRRYGGS